MVKLGNPWAWKRPVIFTASLSIPLHQRRFMLPRLVLLGENTKNAESTRLRMAVKTGKKSFIKTQKQALLIWLWIPTIRINLLQRCGNTSATRGFLIQEEREADFSSAMTVVSIGQKKQRKTVCPLEN